MKAGRKIRISYVTRNEFKIEENKLFKEWVRLSDGTVVDQLSSLTFVSFRLKKS